MLDSYMKGKFMTALTRRMLNNVRYVVFLLLVIFTCHVSQAQDNNDMNIVKDRIIRLFLDTDLDTENALQILETLKSDGSWPGIDYQDQTRAGWPVKQHLENLQVLVLAYKSPKSSLRNDPRLKQAISASLDYWFKHDFQNPNWWHNTIGTPKLLSPVLLTLDKELTSRQRSKGIEILQRGKLGMTGQNLVWVAEITINRGIMQEDQAIVHSGFSRLIDEIKITTKEGIQPDFSFHQHGNCLYNHGYGASFAESCSRLAVIAGNTCFAFPPEKINIITNYILEGSQWLAYGSTPDYGAHGRAIARPGKHSAKYLFDAVNNLLKLPTGREKELKALAARTKNRKTAPLQGNRHFWNSDIMTHMRKNYYTSARMYSKRLLNTDKACNGEGLKNHYIADGCNYLFVSGDEYQAIFPVWNWQKIPGTTIQQNGLFEGSPRKNGTTDFVGGVSDGNYGLAVFDFQRNELSAKKAWFFFDRQYICLGAGITCDSQYQVLTTVNQCHLRGEVTAIDSSTEKQLPKGTHTLRFPITIHHDNVAYVFNTDADILLENTTRTGSWQSISTSRSNEQISHGVFTLCVDHKTKPKDAAYSYIVYPNTDKQQAKACSEDSTIEILSNTPDLQAVKHRELGLSLIAFFKAGSLKIDKTTTVETDKPSLLMVHHLGSELHLSVADPTQKIQVINLKISGSFQGDQCKFDPTENLTTISLTLPEGDYAGRSTVKKYSIY